MVSDNFNMSCLKQPTESISIKKLVSILSIKKLISILYIPFVFAFFSDFAFADEIASLQKWLDKPRSERGFISDQDFAVKPISRKQAELALELLWADHVKNVWSEHKKEWDEKSIKLGKLKMRFDYKVFGKKPKRGRRLFISMHGGGGVPAWVNDQQWRNQIKLYHPKEGVYLVPRAPTDVWNLWHQPHIDRFFTRIITDAVIFENVDPNRVYIIGYSAGGDGVYQLAPRMADQFAAASMMAGHPNNAQPYSLRNIGFSIHVGGKDSAYNRNKKAKEWKKWLIKLREGDPKGYKHKIVIYPQFGHWMHQKDAAAIQWMSKFERLPYPDKVVWKQASVIHTRFYWLSVDKENQKAGSFIVAKRNGQTFTIDKAEKLNRIYICLNDSMVDFNKPIIVQVGSQKHKFNNVHRNIKTIASTFYERGDPKSVYSAKIKVDLK